MGLLAHVGAGLDGLWAGLVHPLTGIDHLLAMVAVGLLAAAAVDRRTAWRTPAVFVAGLLVGGVVGIAGMATRLTEPAIAVSVVALGGLLAATLLPSARVAHVVPPLAAAFGLAHGLAHGAELPGSASPAAYVVGFVAATVALHLCGVLVGSTVGRHTVVRATLAGGISMAGVVLVAGLPT